MTLKLSLICATIALLAGCTSTSSQPTPPSSGSLSSEMKTASKAERLPAQVAGCNFTKFDGEGLVSAGYLDEKKIAMCREAEQAGKKIVGFSYFVYGLGQDYWFTVLESQKQKVMRDFLNAANADAGFRCRVQFPTETCKLITTFFTGMEEGKGFARTLFIVE